MPKRPASAPRARLRHSHSAVTPNSRFQPEYMILDKAARDKVSVTRRHVNQDGQIRRGFASLGYEVPELELTNAASIVDGVRPAAKRPQSAQPVRHDAVKNNVRGPAVVNMSASLATRWKDHLKSSGLDQASGRKAIAAKHVQRVRRATSRRMLSGSGSANSSVTASRRPFSAGMNGRPTSATASMLSIASATNSETRGKRPTKRRPRPKSANPRGRNARASQSPQQKPMSPFARFGHVPGTNPDVGEGRQMGAGIRDFIENVRSLRRSNIIDHTKTQTTNNMRDQIQREFQDTHAKQVHDLRTKLNRSERNLVDMTDKYQDTERRLVSAMDERSSLAFNVTMLRKRLQLLTAREIENQRRLETFSRFAPLFDALDAYSSPADAMRRLSVLEKEQGSSYAKARHAEETLVETTKSHTQAMKKLEAKNAELSVELLSVREKLEKKISNLESQLHEARQDMRSFEGYRQKYLDTTTAVRACYERALRSAELLDAKDPRIALASEQAVADVGRPLQMLEHLGLLFENSNPTQASLKVHMLTGVINRMWTDMAGEAALHRDETNEDIGEGKITSKHDGSDNQNDSKDKMSQAVVAPSPGDPSTHLFKPDKILKIVGDRLRNARIREHNVLSKLNNVNMQLEEAHRKYLKEDKKNIKIERELERLKMLLRKGSGSK